MTTPHETALRDLVYQHGWIDADGTTAICAYDMILFATEFAPILAALAGGQYVSPEQLSSGWERLMDSDWINIVNAPSVLDAHGEEAVNEAVRLTEARLKKLNAAVLAVQPATSASKGDA